MLPLLVSSIQKYDLPESNATWGGLARLVFQLACEVSIFCSAMKSSMAWIGSCAANFLSPDSQARPRAANPHKDAMR